MQEVQERSGGVWSPSPGSVYPALAQLEDEGLIRTEEVEGRRAFAITDAGTEFLAQRGERPAPWDEMSGELGDDFHAIGKLMRDVAFAFAQVMRTGSEPQIARARTVLENTRRELYTILADGEGESGEA
jgi:DNA-binding PadR family transcriptional regulator